MWPSGRCDECSGDECSGVSGSSTGSEGTVRWEISGLGEIGQSRS